MTSNKFIIFSVVVVFAVSSTSCSKPGTTNSTRKLIIDTDAGGDDAVGILMATGAEELDNCIKIIGITCVNGNTGVDNVTVNVLKTLNVVNRLDIPVYKGASHPLLLASTEDYYFGQDGFGDFNYLNPPSKHLIQKKHAVIAMIELVMAHPGEVTLLALGPLTNVALAIRLYPSFLDDLHQLIIMGGSTEGRGNIRPGIEFNFFADPVANYVVFNSSTSKPVTLVPWETTLRTLVTMKFRMSLSRFKNPKVWLIDSAEGLTFRPEAEYWYCADAVATAVALTSGSIVTKTETYYSQAIYDGAQTSGMIVVDYSNTTGHPANTDVIHRIHVEEYKKLLLRYFSS